MWSQGFPDTREGHVGHPGPFRRRDDSVRSPAHRTCEPGHAHGMFRSGAVADTAARRHTAEPATHQEDGRNPRGRTRRPRAVPLSPGSPTVRAPWSSPPPAPPPRRSGHRRLGGGRRTPRLGHPASEHTRVSVTTPQPGPSPPRSGPPPPPPPQERSGPPVPSQERSGPPPSPATVPTALEAVRRHVRRRPVPRHPALTTTVLATLSCRPCL